MAVPQSATAAGLEMVGASLAGSAVTASSASAQDTNSISDSAILNFALNLQYLEGEFYSFAVHGHGLPDNLTHGTGKRGPVIGGRAVPFKTRSVRRGRAGGPGSLPAWPVVCGPGRGRRSVEHGGWWSRDLDAERAEGTDPAAPARVGRQLAANHQLIAQAGQAPCRGYRRRAASDARQPTGYGTSRRAGCGMRAVP